MVQNLKMLVLMPFAVIKGLNTSILLPTLHNRMELWSGRIGRWLRWRGRCSMSIGLLANTGLRRLTLLVTCPTAFSCMLSCTGLLMSCGLDVSPVLTISEFLVAGALCSKMEILISLSLARLTIFFSVMLLTLEHTVC